MMSVLVSERWGWCSGIFQFQSGFCRFIHSHWGSMWSRMNNRILMMMMSLAGIPTASCGRSSSTLCSTFPTAIPRPTCRGYATSWRLSCSETTAASWRRSRAAWWFNCWRAARLLADNGVACRPEMELLPLISVWFQNFNSHQLVQMRIHWK